MSSLGTKTTALFLAAALPPLLGCGAAAYFVARSALLRDASARQEAAGRAAARVVQDYLDRAQAKLHSLAALASSEGGRASATRAALARRFDALVEPADLFLEVNFVEADPVPNVHEQRTSQLFGAPVQIPVRASPPVDSPLLRESLSGANWISPAIVREQGFAFLDLSTPVRVGEGVTGALAARLNMGPLEALLGQVAAEQGLSIALDRGSPHPLREAGARLELAVSSGHADWTIRVAQERSRATATLDRIAGQALIWLAVGTGLALALSLAFTRGLLRPIRALHRASASLARGERGARAGSARRDELGDLSRAFDRMAESLEKLDALKDEFVAHVSHELRTPLTSAKMSLGNLRDGIPGPVTPKQAAVLARIEADLDRLVRMVNELLDLARIQAGKVRIAPRTVDLRALASSCLADLAPLAKGRSVPLEGEGSARVDPEKFRQVLLNLLDNALRHGRGAVRVAVGPGTVRVFSGGSPIPPERRDRLFESFSPSTEGGAGLGLAIARRIAILHGGALRYEPAPGGNLFVVEAPCPPASSS
ncbi:MAG: HAMP domain-containing histidine kinase [Planctomycetes bacterium]|nr:HAMP domain-containing histidine kinase [Planctomycetota bacterium]